MSLNVKWCVYSCCPICLLKLIKFNGDIVCPNCRYRDDRFSRFLLLYKSHADEFEHKLEIMNLELFKCQKRLNELLVQNAVNNDNSKYLKIFNELKKKV